MEVRRMGAAPGYRPLSAIVDDQTIIVTHMMTEAAAGL
jgi:hypothetical protein